MAGLAAGLSAATIAAVAAALFWSGLLSTALPLLTVLGPAIVVQYAFWRRLAHRERTTRDWRDGVPPVVTSPDPLLPLEAALEIPLPEPLPEGVWIAMSENGVVGTGASPGLARRAARENGHIGMPFVRQT